MLSAVSTVEDMRRGNLARFLELVHRERALSRSQLTTATGLNRSTVAALAAELVDLGLVVERQHHQRLRGRSAWRGVNDDRRGYVGGGWCEAPRTSVRAAEVQSGDGPRSLPAVVEREALLLRPAHAPLCLGHLLL